MYYHEDWRRFYAYKAGLTLKEANGIVGDSKVFWVEPDNPPNSVSKEEFDHAKRKPTVVAEV
jgi:hypothetical protein